MQEKKLLIFISAYNAGYAIENVLDKIPGQVQDSYDCEILVIDDSSKDDTLALARRFRDNKPELRMKVLHNPDKLGYGGNQKLGMHYAEANAFDIIVLLHGDGKYAPEVMERLISPIAEGKAEMVMGSRMMDGAGGKMPWLRRLGNRMLSKYQNRKAKSSLTEWHCGYRAYAVRSLAHIPYQRNTDSYHFDTQIILQYLLRGSKIEEVPVPAYNSKELQNLRGLNYMWQVRKTMRRFRNHQMSILYRREFDISPEEPDYSPKFGYASSHSMAVQRVPEGARVLDIGCNVGHIAAKLKEKGCRVRGIDMLKQEGNPSLDHYHRMDLNDTEKLPDMQQTDYILALDVIEHLNRPELFLDKIRELTGKEKPLMIITVPNVAFFIVRLQLLFSRFNYGKQGILDMTHTRLFTFRSFRRLLQQSGYQVERIRGVPAPFPKALGKNALSMMLVRINQLLIILSRTLFSYQIYIEARPAPMVNELLAVAVNESDNP